MTDEDQGKEQPPIVAVVATTLTRLRPPSAMRGFLRSEAAGGIVLMIAAALAMILSLIHI